MRLSGKEAIDMETHGSIHTLLSWLLTLIG